MAAWPFKMLCSQAGTANDTNTSETAWSLQFVPIGDESCFFGGHGFNCHAFDRAENKVQLVLLEVKWTLNLVKEFKWDTV